MVLNSSSSLFGDQNKFLLSDEFVRFAARSFQRMLAPGFGSTSLTIPVTTSASYKDKNFLGFQIEYSVRNQSGHTDYVDISIVNTTTSVTLYSYNDVPISNSTVYQFDKFFNSDLVQPGDVITLTLAGDGISTAAGAGELAYCSMTVSVIYKSTDDVS